MIGECYIVHVNLEIIAKNERNRPSREEETYGI